MKTHILALMAFAVVLSAGCSRPTDADLRAEFAVKREIIIQVADMLDADGLVGQIWPEPEQRSHDISDSRRIAYRKLFQSLNEMKCARGPSGIISFGPPNSGIFDLDKCIARIPKSDLSGMQILPAGKRGWPGSGGTFLKPLQEDWYLCLRED